MDRRSFVVNSGLTLFGLSYNLNKALTLEEIKKLKKAIPLKTNDKVALIAPGSPPKPEKLNLAITQIKSLGFQVVEGANLRKKAGFLAGTDAQRLSDLHQMFADKSIKGIWCVRGGYGCTRLLPMLDFKLIKNNPKVLIGYSDITALSNAIYQKTGLVGIHGIVGSSPFNEYSVNALKSLLFKATKNQVLNNHPNDTVDTLYPGIGKGRLLGGNLTVMTAMAGTPYEIQAKNKIIFIEDVGEKPYRIDRMLTQLIQSSQLNKAKGIILGQFRNCESASDDPHEKLLFRLKNLLLPLKIPCVYGFSFGHVEHNMSLPVGAMVQLDTNKKEVKILENIFN